MSLSRIKSVVNHLNVSYCQTKLPFLRYFWIYTDITQRLVSQSDITKRLVSQSDISKRLVSQSDISKRLVSQPDTHFQSWLAFLFDFTWTQTRNFFNWNLLHARLNSHYEAWNYKKKKYKRLKHMENLFRKKVQIKKRCLLILNLQPFRSKVKGKHSISREFQSLAVPAEKLLTQTSLKHLGMVTEKSSNLSE